MLSSIIPKDLELLDKDTQSLKELFTELEKHAEKVEELVEMDTGTTDTFLVEQVLFLFRYSVRGVGDFVSVLAGTIPRSGSITSLDLSGLCCTVAEFVVSSSATTALSCEHVASRT